MNISVHYLRRVIHAITDSDSVVTISEADIDSFSIGFIPDGNWTSEVSTNLPTSNTPGDPFSPGLQPLDLNITGSSDTGHAVVQSSTGSSANDLAISGAIYTTSDSFQNIKTGNFIYSFQSLKKTSNCKKIIQFRFLFRYFLLYVNYCKKIIWICSTNYISKISLEFKNFCKTIEFKSMRFQ